MIQYSILHTYQCIYCIQGKCFLSVTDVVNEFHQQRFTITILLLGSFSFKTIMPVKNNLAQSEVNKSPIIRFLLVNVVWAFL
jgi:hypothetical protein